MIKFIYTWIINPFIKRFPETPVSVINKQMPDAEFDIENESVFSVERNEDDETIIGYYPADGTENIEWNIICSIEQHNNFIKRFRTKLGF